MNRESIIEQIEAEISKLEKAKSILLGAQGGREVIGKRGPGRPKKT